MRYAHNAEAWVTLGNHEIKCKTREAPSSTPFIIVSTITLIKQFKSKFFSRHFKETSRSLLRRFSFCQLNFFHSGYARDLKRTFTGYGRVYFSSSAFSCSNVWLSWWKVSSPLILGSYKKEKLIWHWTKTSLNREEWTESRNVWGHKDNSQLGSTLTKSFSVSQSTTNKR